MFKLLNAVMFKLRGMALFIIFFLFSANAFAEKNVIVMYVGGDFYSIEYHLGVLSEIERLQIPIDTVVGSNWGALVGALWSSGWSSGQIRETVKSWDSIPRAKDFEKAALWKKSWLVKHSEDGALFLKPLTENKPYFGQIFFDLRIQELLWRIDSGSKIPFRAVDSADAYPFPESSHGEPAKRRIISTPIALRDTSGTSEKIYQQKLWKQDSTLIILRPHSKPNPDSLFEAGVHAVQSKRSDLAKISLGSQPVSYKEQELPEPRFLYHPVFDNISAEYQGHLESFWNEADTGGLAIRNFLENLQKNGFYREVELTLDTGSFLQIKASSSPQLSLSLYGFGGTLFGANIAGNLNFRFVNQFIYNLGLTGFYGQGARGVEPDLRLEQFFMDNGNFFVKAKIYEYEPIPFFQKSIYDDARLLKENGRAISVGVEKSALRIGVEFGRMEILSGASKRFVYEEQPVFDEDGAFIGLKYDLVDVIYEPVVVNSMFPYVKWLLQSEGYDRWFASEGYMAELTGGFKAISIASFGQPLYFSSQGKTSIAHPLSRYVSISGGTEFGANFRRTDKGKIILPDDIYGYSYNIELDNYGQNTRNVALDNRFRFAMGMGSFREVWQTPVNSSHRYGLISAGLSAQWNGSGIFLAGGYANNGVRMFFAEPKLRIKAPTFDFVLGQSIIYSDNNRDYDTKRREKHTFMSIQGGIL